MREIRDYSDSRNKAWCIHCGTPIAAVPANMDHVPSQCLLSRKVRDAGRIYDTSERKLRNEIDEEVDTGDMSQSEDYLPQVLICKRCNSSFSSDETYLLCVLHAVMSGSLEPNEGKFPEAAKVLRSNGHVVRALRPRMYDQLSLFDERPGFTLFPDMERVTRVIIKNARGHAFHEIATLLEGEPDYTRVTPLSLMSAETRAQFEATGGGLDLWPEVGSRMLVRVINGEGLAGGWIEVEPGRYRYSLDWSNGVRVRTVIWDYLATETYWTE